MASQARPMNVAPWRQKHDPQNLLGSVRHYSPEVVLRKFCRAKAKDVDYFESRPWNEDRDEREVMTVYDVQAKKLADLHISQCFGAADIYERLFSNLTEEMFARDGNSFKLLDTLKSVDESIQSGIRHTVTSLLKDLDEADDSISMTRTAHNRLRKYLFLAASRQNKDDVQHLLNHDERMHRAAEKRKKFIAEHKLSHERELWLHNTSAMIKSDHYDIPTQKAIHELDRLNYQTNARERFMVIWRASGADDEFLLTDNSFGCLEGGPLGADDSKTVDITSTELAKHVYTKDYVSHQLFVISPKLVIALCHGSLLDEDLTKKHRERYGLVPSLLENLPHHPPRMVYKDMSKDECSFIDPSWSVSGGVANAFGSTRHTSKSADAAHVGQEMLGFAVKDLDSIEVAKVNAVLLQNRSAPSPLHQICVRLSSERSLRRALKAFEGVKWEKHSDIEQRKRFSTLTAELDARKASKERSPLPSNASWTSHSRGSSSGAPSVTLDDNVYENPFDRRTAPPASYKPVIHQSAMHDPQSPTRPSPLSRNSILAANGFGAPPNQLSPRERSHHSRSSSYANDEPLIIPSRSRQSYERESNYSHRRSGSYSKEQQDRPAEKGYKSVYRPSSSRRESVSYVKDRREPRYHGEEPTDRYVISMTPSGYPENEPELRFPIAINREDSARTVMPSDFRRGRASALANDGASDSTGHRSWDDEGYAECTPSTSTLPEFDAEEMPPPSSPRIQRQQSVRFESPPKEKREDRRRRRESERRR